MKPFYKKAIPSGRQRGFTIMEIMVATTLFAFTSVALTTLFNYTLKINRRAEALRQATQGIRDFVELIAKEVRNGQIDYGVVDPGQVVEGAPVGPCPIPSSAAYSQSLIGVQNVASSYQTLENKLGVVDINGVQSCFYLGLSSTDDTPVANTVHTGQLYLKKGSSGVPQPVNTPNLTVNYLGFLIRPTCDPYGIYCQDYGNHASKIQPFVTIMANFTTKLPTGEQVNLYYQTTVSTDKYDVPNLP